jgi:hypothetical protein
MYVCMYVCMYVLMLNCIYACMYNVYVCILFYISHALAGSLVSVGVGPWHGMVKGAGSNLLCVY